MRLSHGSSGFTALLVCGLLSACDRTEALGTVPTRGEAGDASASPSLPGVGIPSTEDALAGGPIAQQFGLGQVCEGDGWCWYNPRPTGDDWHQIWVGANDDVWIGGRAGFMLHGNGYTWTTVPWPAAELGGSVSEIDAFWGSGAHDIWAGGIGGILHWNGSTWTVAIRTSRPDEQVIALWGVAANDVYAAVIGTSPLLHWDGRAWSRVAALPSTVVPGGKTLWGTAANDVWLGALDGAWHFDGKAWARSPGLDGFVEALWVSPAGDVWAVVLGGGARAIWHFDGSRWRTSYAFPDTNSFLPSAITGSSSRDVWVVGGDFTRVAATGRVGGAALQWDGSNWTSSSVVPAQIFGAAPRAAGMVTVVAAAGQIWNLNTGAAGAIAGTPLTGGLEVDLTSVWGSSSEDVWLVGRSGTLLHWDGAQMVKSSASTAGVDFTSIWGTGASDVWVVGTAGVILHYDGRLWASVDSGTQVTLRAVWASGPRDVWVAGDRAVVLHWTGDSFERVNVPGWTAEDRTLAPIFAISGTAGNDVWIAGGAIAGLISHFDGQAFSAPVHPSIAVSFSSIWAISRTDVWAQEGDRYFDTYHFDGSSWQLSHAGRNAFSGRALWAGGPADVWTIGGNGGAHFNGTSWSGPVLTAQGAENARAVFGFAPTDDLWVVGQRGLIIRHVP